MIVYLDLILVTNVCFDAAILMMTAKVRGLGLRIWRTCAACALGAAYLLLMFVPSFDFLYTVIAKLLFSLAVVAVAFGFGGLQHYMRNVGAFYLVHFAAAGAMFAVHFLLLSSGETMRSLLLMPSGGVAFAVESGLWLSVPAFLLSLLFFRSVFRSKERADALAACKVEVEVVIKGVAVACGGLVDTGNQLYDPLTRVPVMVMECGPWRGKLPDKWLERVKQRDAERLLAELDDDDVDGFRDRVRLVPYRGVNGTTRFMLALKPDKVVIRRGDAIHETGRVLVALDGGTMAAGGEYQAIVHPMLVPVAV